MSKKAYCNALELRIRKLADRLAALQQRSKRAPFVEKFHCSRDIQRLEKRKRELEARLSELAHQEEGFWEDIKANIRGVVDELPSGVERWMERLDQSYAASSTSHRAEGHSIVAHDLERTRRAP